MRDEFDSRLKEAMRPSQEPDFWLNQKIINGNQEVKKMGDKRWKRTAVTVGAIGLLMVSSVGVTAAVRYFSADQVAEKTEDNKLMAAFNSKDAIDINETQQTGGYDITLLGMVSGKNLSDYKSYVDGELQSDKTYAVVAIDHADGTKMQEKDKDGYNVGYIDQFFVSPFIEGYNPNQYNAYAFNGGATYFVKDGVLYWLLETDNLEMFATHTIYLGVTESLGTVGEAYVYQEDSGKIEKKEDYSGVSALFTLPIDKSKGSEEKAKAYMDSLWGEEDDTEEAEETDADSEFFDNLTLENIEEYATREESTVQILKPDKDGYITWKCELKDETSTDGTMLVDGDDSVGELRVTSCGTAEKGEVFETLVRNEDGTYTVAMYRIK